MFRRIAIVGAITLLPVRTAFAHGGRANPETWWTAWNRDPLVLLSVALLAWFYVQGLRRLRLRSGGHCPVKSWQTAAFFCSLALLLVALISPLDALSEELSSAHMVQHMLLMTAAAPLFVLGSPNLVLAWGLSAQGEVRRPFFLRSAFRLIQAPLLRNPFFVWALFAAMLWGWHHPRLYESALREPIVHDIQHLSFYGAACLFWRTALDPLNRRRLRSPAVIPYLFATSVHASALGVFLALSPRVWYDEYVGTTVRWGLTPLEDQQLAGVIMWVPGCLVYPAVAAVLSGIWLANPDRFRRRRCWPKHESVPGA